MHFLHFMQQYGTLGVFVLVMLEAIGIPFPAETILVTAGISLPHGVLPAVTYSLAAAGGNILGSTIAYTIGLYLGRPLIIKFGKYVGITEARLHGVEERFRKSTATFVVVAKFIAFVRIVVPYLAGVNKISFGRFMTLNGVAAILWASLFITLGKSVESVWNRYKDFFLHHLVISSLILVAVILVIVLVKWVEHRPHRGGDKAPNIDN